MEVYICKTANETLLNIIMPMSNCTIQRRYFWTLTVTYKGNSPMLWLRFSLSPRPRSCHRHELMSNINVYKTAVCAMRSERSPLKDTEGLQFLQVIEVMVFSKNKMLRQHENRVVKIGCNSTLRIVNFHRRKLLRTSEQFPSFQFCSVTLPRPRDGNNIPYHK